jgi:hypothetical protein
MFSNHPASSRDTLLTVSKTALAAACVKSETAVCARMGSIVPGSGVASFSRSVFGILP